MFNLLDMVSQAVVTAKNNDEAMEAVAREAQATAAVEARQQALAKKEDEKWAKLVDYFRNVPENESTRSFTAAAEELYKSSRFNAEVMEVLRMAIQADPTRFYALTVRDYLRRHDDDVTAELYMSRFLSTPANTAELDKGHATVWAAKAALSVVAAAVDKTNGPAKKEARNVLKQFCTLTLDRFPKLPTEFYNLLTHVESIGDLHDPLLNGNKIPTPAEGAAEKGDYIPKPAYSKIPAKKYAPVPAKTSTSPATKEEVNEYKASAVAPASAPIGEYLATKLEGLAKKEKKAKKNGNGNGHVPGSLAHREQIFETAAVMADGINQ